MADRTEQPTISTRWFSGPTWPTWAVAAFFYATSATWTMALSVAIRGEVSWIFLLVAANSLVPLWVQRDYWRLDVAERTRVSRAMRSARPTGDAKLDAVALTVLRKAAISPRGDLIGLWVIAVLFAVVPIVAAVRGSAWWLLSLLPAMMLIWAIRPRRARTSPRERLERFQRALDPSRTSSTGP